MFLWNVFWGFVVLIMSTNLMLLCMMIQIDAQGWYFSGHLLNTLCWIINLGKKYCLVDCSISFWGCCMQALSKRIHYGKFVAEAKFQASPDSYEAAIRRQVCYLLSCTCLCSFLLKLLLMVSSIVGYIWQSRCHQNSFLYFCQKIPSKF